MRAFFLLAGARSRRYSLRAQVRFGVWVAEALTQKPAVMSMSAGPALEKSEGFSVPYLYLLIAVALEVCGTMLLPVSQNFTRPLPTLSLIACYAASVYCLTFALNTLPIAVVYATWSGLGIFLITVFGYLFFEQALEWRAIVGLVMIVIGVVLVNGVVANR